jgi:hypothetical protein
MFGARTADPDAIDKPTEAEFNQTIEVIIKDLGEWWVRKKSEGLTEEKSLDSFINKLVLVIDGVPLNHLQPVGIDSTTPTDPWHSPRTSDAAKKDKAWRDWTIGNARKSKEIVFSKGTRS